MQSVAKIPVDVRALGVDLLSLSAHKFNGPKGAGALWIKRGTRVTSILTGGKHERNRRAGTENVPAIAGLGVAAALAAASWRRRRRGSPALRDRLEDAILASVPRTAVNGAREPRVPNTTNISFDGVEAESLLIALDLEGVAVSTGSACSSGTLEPSHVLRAMGLPAHRTQNSIRFSLGAGNTDEQVDYLARESCRDRGEAALADGGEAVDQLQLSDLSCQLSVEQLPESLDESARALRRFSADS